MKTPSNFEEYLERRYRINSIRGIIYSIDLYKEWCDKERVVVERANYNDLMGYIKYCYKQGNKKRTIQHKLNSLKHYYNYIQEYTIKEESKDSINPVGEIRIRNIEKTEVKNNINYEDIEKLYKDYPSMGLTHKRNKCMLGLLIYQGLRTSEINKLEIKDVKLEEGKIYIPALARTNSRILKLESHQIIQLQTYIVSIRPILEAISEDKGNYLFITSGRSKRKTDRSNIFTSIGKMCRQIRKMCPEIKDVQDIRSAVISHWLKQYSIRQVQYMTGHRYVSSTEKYSRNKLESLQEQIEKLHPF